MIFLVASTKILDGAHEVSGRIQEVSGRTCDDSEFIQSVISGWYTCSTKFLVVHVKILRTYKLSGWYIR